MFLRMKRRKRKATLASRTATKTPSPNKAVSNISLTKISHLHSRSMELIREEKRNHNQKDVLYSLLSD